MSTACSDASATASTVGKRAIQRSKVGMTVLARVCCSITSLTQIAYGSSVILHGRLSCPVSHQASNKEAVLTLIAGDCSSFSPAGDLTLSKSAFLHSLLPEGVGKQAGHRPLCSSAAAHGKLAGVAKGAQSPPFLAARPSCAIIPPAGDRGVAARGQTTTILSPPPAISERPIPARSSGARASIHQARSETRR